VSTQTYVLGQEIQHKDKPHLVVRFDKCVALFENEDGTTTKIEEEFVQLRGQDGGYEFVTISERIEPFDKKSSLKALPAVPWRVKWQHA
jgi:hypothetical protein